MQDVTEIDIAWLAGLLEGEGNFYSYTRSSPRISLGMTDLDIIRRATKIMNGDINKIRVVDQVNRKISFVIQIGGHKALICMKLIRPYMGDRRGAKIDELLKAVDEHRPFAYLGSDYCHQKGHSIKYNWEYMININGSKRCKRCKGIRVIAPTNHSGIKLVNPFEKVS